MSGAERNCVLVTMATTRCFLSATSPRRTPFCALLSNIFFDVKSGFLVRLAFLSVLEFPAKRRTNLIFVSQSIMKLLFSASGFISDKKPAEPFSNKFSSLKKILCLKRDQKKKRKDIRRTFPI